MVSTQKTISLTKTEEAERKSSSKHRRKVAKVFQSRKFKILVLLIAIVDVFLVATQLVNNILAVILEEGELCDTENILIYLNTTHAGQLDEYFGDNTVDEIMEDLDEAHDELLHRYRRQLVDVTELEIRTSTTPQLPSLPTLLTGSAAPTTRSLFTLTAPTTLRPQSTNGAVPKTTTPPRGTDSGEETDSPPISQPTTENIETKTTTVPSRPTDSSEESTTSPISRPTDSAELTTIAYDFVYSSEYTSTNYYRVADVVGIISTAVLTLVFVMKVARIIVEGKSFFDSKLQVFDAAVIMVFLPIDYVYLPSRWASDTVMGTTLPILFDVVSRVSRVVICSLVVLQATDKELRILAKKKVKESTKQYRCFKNHIANLQDLARKQEAEESQLIACKKHVRAVKKNRKQSKTVEGVMSINRLLFLAAPLSYPEKDQHIVDEQADPEERSHWVHPRTISTENAKRSRFRDADIDNAPNTEELTISSMSLASASTSSYDESDEEEDLDEIVEDTTDYNNLTPDDLNADADDTNVNTDDQSASQLRNSDYVTTHL